MLHRDDNFGGDWLAVEPVPRRVVRNNDDPRWIRTLYRKDISRTHSVAFGRLNPGRVWQDWQRLCVSHTRVKNAMKR